MFTFGVKAEMEIGMMKRRWALTKVQSNRSTLVLSKGSHWSFWDWVQFYYYCEYILSFHVKRCNNTLSGTFRSCVVCGGLRRRRGLMQGLSIEAMHVSLSSPDCGNCWRGDGAVPMSFTPGFSRGFDACCSTLKMPLWQARHEKLRWLDFGG